MVLGINEDKTIIYSNAVDGYNVIKAKSIVMSTGCSERTRGAIAIPGDRPSGIMSAGLAQRYLNIDGYLVGKKVFILGSGDIGLIMARRMTLEGAKVLGVAELMPYSNGLNRNIVQCLNDFDIPLYLSHSVSKIVGKDRIEKVIISKVDDHFNFIEGSEIEFDVDTLLLSVGLIPNNPLLQNIGVIMHPKTKGPIVDEYLQTNISGIFACGNSLHVHDLVDFVTNEGKICGKSVALYLNEKLNNNRNVNILNGNLVSYCMPKTIYLNSSDTVKINFRVQKPLKNITLVIKQNDKVIKETKKSYLIPAEMESVVLNKKDLDLSDITLEVRE
jgi:pyruvate/2-oxoglutarate dehydrogenase complex dihydrolipoamide dehydrogenase (E3) component